MWQSAFLQSQNGRLHTGDSFCVVAKPLALWKSMHSWNGSKKATSATNAPHMHNGSGLVHQPIYQGRGRMGTGMGQWWQLNPNPIPRPHSCSWWSCSTDFAGAGQSRHLCPRRLILHIPEGTNVPLPKGELQDAHPPHMMQHKMIRLHQQGKHSRIGLLNSWLPCAWDNSHLGEHLLPLEMEFLGSWTSIFSFSEPDFMSGLVTSSALGHLCASASHCWQYWAWWIEGLT